MASDDRTAGTEQDRRTTPRSRLFAVRLWTEEVAGGREYRGSVRDVVSGAFRNFRDWPELAAFMTERMAEVEHAQAKDMEGATPWPLNERR